MENLDYVCFELAWTFSNVLQSYLSPFPKEKQLCTQRPSRQTLMHGPVVFILFGMSSVMWCLLAWEKSKKEKMEIKYNTCTKNFSRQEIQVIWIFFFSLFLSFQKFAVLLSWKMGFFLSRQIVADIILKDSSRPPVRKTRARWKNW